MNKYNNSPEILQALVYKKPLSKEEFIGLITIVIYSKDIFVKNEDVANFVKNIFGLSFLDYVIKSRTLLCARLARNLVSMNDAEIKNATSKVTLYFKTKEFIIQSDEDLSKNKKVLSTQKHNANRDVSTWINALLKKDKK